jgi:hypothetical protein
MNIALSKASRKSILRARGISQLVLILILLYPSAILPDRALITALENSPYVENIEVDNE